MMALRRKVMAAAKQGSILPAAYQQVEWVQATNGAYIDTNYTPTVNTRAELEYELTSNGNSHHFLFGIEPNSPCIKVEFRYGSRWYIRCCEKNVNNPSELLDVGLTANTRYVMSLTPTAFSINTATVTPSNNLINNNFDHVYLYAGNNAGSPYEAIDTMKVYDFKFFENDTLSLHFVPCYRKSDNEIGFYDTVAGAFYGNSGTGTLLKGADV